jgi:hypothetical protein
MRKKESPSVHAKQGDQIGRIFGQWVFYLFGQFLEDTIVAQVLGLPFFHC